jgi:hypothetical protein
MLSSPFAFYLAAAVVMAGDLAAGSRYGLVVQCCGDAHLANFGGFAAPDRAPVFDVSDFDETHPGPFEWDVVRLAASLEIAARARSAGRKASRAIVQHAARTYRTAMRQFGRMSDLDVWYARLDVDTVLKRWRRDVPASEIVRLQRMVTESREKTSLKSFAKLTRRVDGEVRIVSDPPLVVPLDELLPDLEELYDSDLRAWLDVIRQRKALVHRAGKETSIKFSDDLQPQEIQEYCACLPQTVKTRRIGKTLVIENPAHFHAWLVSGSTKSRWWERLFRR